MDRVCGFTFKWEGFSPLRLTKWGPRVKSRWFGEGKKERLKLVRLIIFVMVDGVSSP